MTEPLCPRCKKTPLSPGEGICASCQAELLAGGTREAMTLDLVPVLREALATTAPGEDFDEALLRALKRLHPAHAEALFPAFSRLLQVEMERTGEEKRVVAQRIADSSHPPKLTFSSNLARPGLVSETRVTTSQGKTYRSLDEMPPDLRRAVESQLRGPREKPKVKMGCSLLLALGLLLALLAAWR